MISAAQRTPILVEFENSDISIDSNYNHLYMLETVELTLQANCHLDRQQAILVAVSGGPDSLCLLHRLWGLNYKLVVAHLDHSLRPESADEGAIVQRTTQRLGIQYVFARRDVPAYASQNGLSIEEAARNVRYHFLFEQAQILGLQAVAVGHTADDQVETVLMHLLRGAGLSGLRGMSYYSLSNPWSQTIPLVRPLLGIWREEIMAYLAQQGLQPSQDASNLDKRYYRNRLRHDLIPHLEELNPGVRRRVWTMAALLQDDDETIERVVDAAWGQCGLIGTTGAVAFDIVILRDQPKGVQRRLIRRAIARLLPSLRDIDYETVDRALEFLSSPTRTGQMDLAAGLRLEMEGTRLWMADWKADLPGANWPQLTRGERLELAVPGETRLSSGWILRADILGGGETTLAQAQANADPFQAWLDLERLKQPLIIRSRASGERFRPLGMGGHSLKLSDFMVNVGLPRRARANWPLLAAGEEIIWVPGYRIAETVGVKPNTLELLRLNLKVT
jgi:tRNA(Ile)-lysidine synthase